MQQGPRFFPAALLLLLALLAGRPEASSVCRAIPLVNSLGQPQEEGDIKRQFDAQLELLALPGRSEAEYFSAEEADPQDDSLPLSTFYWNPCREVPAVPECPEAATCCQVMRDGSAQQCGDARNSTLMIETEARVEDATFVGGVRLTYRNGYGLPGGNRTCFQLDLLCNPFVEYVQVPGVARMPDFLWEDSVCFVVRAETQLGCAHTTIKALNLSSAKVIFYALGPVALVVGLMLLGCGWRLFRVTAMVLGLFFGLTLAIILVLVGTGLRCSLVRPEWADAWLWSHDCVFHTLTEADQGALWAAAILGLLCGLLLAVISYKRPAFGGTLIALGMGGWFSDLLYALTFSVTRQHWLILVLLVLICSNFVLISVCSPGSWKRRIFIIGISATGAYLFLWGIGVYALSFPSMALLEEAGPRWQYAVYVTAMAILAALGAALQFNVTGAFEWEDLQSGGLCPRSGRRALDSSLLENEVEMGAAPKSV